MFEESKTPVFDALMVLAREHAVPTTPAALREVYEVLVELRSRELPQAAMQKSTQFTKVDGSPSFLQTRLCRGCGIMLTGDVARSSPTALEVSYCRNCWNQDLQLQPLQKPIYCSSFDIVIKPNDTVYLKPNSATEDQPPSPSEGEATVPADEQCCDCKKFIPHAELVVTDIAGMKRCSDCWDIVCSGPHAATN
jgi:hypothetical protein